jgi:hypothetical protein
MVIGDVTLPETMVTVREEYEEVGGRDARRLRVSGLLPATTLSQLQQQMEQLVQRSFETQLAVVLRPGRVLWARRARLFHEPCIAAGLSGFTLVLEVPDIFEYSEAEHAETWTVSAAPVSRSFATVGNASALPVCFAQSAAEWTEPSWSDGTRTLTYTGTVPAGTVLRLDASARRVTLDGDDVTPYVTGEFPEIMTPSGVLTFTCAEALTEPVLMEVRYRHRWY